MAARSNAGSNAGSSNAGSSNAALNAGHRWTRRSRARSTAVLLAVACLLITLARSTNGTGDATSTRVVSNASVDGYFGATVPPGSSDIRFSGTATGVSFSPKIWGQNLHPYPGTDAYANSKFRTRIAPLAKHLRFVLGIGAEEWGWANCETGVYDAVSGSWSSGNVVGAAPCTTPSAFARLRDFMRLVAAIGAESTIITFNINVTKEENLALVAYVNGEASDTRVIGIDRNGTDWKTVGYWATVRDAGGANRMNTKYFEFGNEINGGGRDTPGAKGCAPGWEVTYTCDPWEVLYGTTLNGKTYDGYVATRLLVKSFFPAVQVGLAASGPGDFGNPNLTEEMVRFARENGDMIDYLTIHPYFYYQLMNLSEDEIFRLPETKAAAIDSFFQGIFARQNNGVAIPVQMPEWNLTSGAPNDVHGYMNGIMGALTTSDFAGRVVQGGFIQGMNFGDVITSLYGTNWYGAMRSDGDFTRNPTYFSWLMWSRFGSEMLPVSHGLDPGNQLAAYAGRRSPGELSLYVVNKSSQAVSSNVIVDGVAGIASTATDVLVGATPSLSDRNAVFNGTAETMINDTVSNAPSTLQSLGGATTFQRNFPARSVSLIRISLTTAPQTTTREPTTIVGGTAGDSTCLAAFERVGDRIWVEISNTQRVNPFNNVTFRFPAGYVVSSPAGATITAIGSGTFVATNFSVNPLPRNTVYPFNFSISGGNVAPSNFALAGRACSSYPAFEISKNTTTTMTTTPRQPVVPATPSTPPNPRGSVPSASTPLPGTRVLVP